MPHSTKSGFVYVILKICGSLFRQVLFVLEAVPDVLDVIVILEGIQQLAHQLELDVYKRQGEQSAALRGSGRL